MSEQGRCFVLVALQLPELLAFVPLAGHSEPFGGWQGIGCLSLLQWVRLIAGLPCLGLGGAGGGHLSQHPPGFSMFHHRLYLAAGPAGLPLREKHETRHDLYIMGVSEANF